MTTTQPTAPQFLDIFTTTEIDTLTADEEPAYPIFDQDGSTCRYARVEKNGSIYNVLRAAFPTGIVRYGVTRYNDYAGGERFTCAWDSLGWLDVEPVAETPVEAPEFPVPVTHSPMTGAAIPSGETFVSERMVPMYNALGEPIEAAHEITTTATLQRGLSAYASDEGGWFLVGRYDSSVKIVRHAAGVLVINLTTDRRGHVREDELTFALDPRPGGTSGCTRLGA